MTQRFFIMLLILTIPAVMLGGGSGRPRYIFKPEIPDTIKGLQIQFEVREVGYFAQEEKSVFIVYVRI